jgi:hypothetical protein
MSVIGVNINLLQQLQETYGVRVESPNVLLNQQIFGDRKRPDVPALKESEFIEFKSRRFSTPVYELMTIYTPDQSRVFQFPEAVIVDMLDSPKIVLRTNIQGRDGSVKEIINNDDDKIVIMGVLISDTYDFPDRMLKELKNLVKYNGHVIVDDLYLNSNGIDQLVLTDLQYQRKKGMPNTLFFKLEAFSDEPVELLIED